MVRGKSCTGGVEAVSSSSDRRASGLVHELSQHRKKVGRELGGEKSASTEKDPLASIRPADTEIPELRTSAHAFAEAVDGSGWSGAGTAQEAHATRDEDDEDASVPEGLESSLS